MEFNKIVSDGTVTAQPVRNKTIKKQHTHKELLYTPNIVMEGFRRPSFLNNGGFSILAKGLFGSGSEGVPSTLVHFPSLLPRPIMLCSTKLWFSITAFGSIMLSLTRTPGPIVTPAPTLTFGPNYNVFFKT